MVREVVSAGEARGQHRRTARALDSHAPGDVVFAYACKLGCEGIVSKRLDSRYRPGPSKCANWIKVKNPAAPAVKREAEEDWGKGDEDADRFALGDHPIWSANVEAFRQKLRDLGHVEGENIVIAYRCVEGLDYRLPKAQAP